MKNLIFAALAALSVSACATVENTPETNETEAEASLAQTIPVKAGSVMAETSGHEDVDHDIRPAAPDHSNETLLYGAMTKYELMSFVEIVSLGGQQAVLEQDDIVTVFAPNNLAFEYAGRPEQDVIAEFLSDHMIAGSFDLQNLKAAISENGGPIELKSMSGKTLNVYHMDGKIKLSGANGVLATIIQSDMMHSNGVMHQVSNVLHRQELGR